MFRHNSLTMQKSAQEERGRTTKNSTHHEKGRENTILAGREIARVIDIRGKPRHAVIRLLRAHHGEGTLAQRSHQGEFAHGPAHLGPARVLSPSTQPGADKNQLRYKHTERHLVDVECRN